MLKTVRLAENGNIPLEVHELEAERLSLLPRNFDAAAVTYADVEQARDVMFRERLRRKRPIALSRRKNAR